MADNIHLIIHNIFGVFSAISLLCLVIFLLFNNIKKTANWTLALTAVAFIGFLVTHVVGVSVNDPLLSRDILMGNISVIFISVFNFHCVMAALHKEKEKRYMIIFIYVIGFGLALFYVLFPQTFLLPSIPKMYFPNYYVPGDLYWVSRVVFQLIVPIYFVYELVKAFRHSSDNIEKNRILYFAISLSFGWIFGIIPVLLIFNIPIDPTWGIFSAVLFLLPFSYAVVKYDLLDIKIVAKRAFVYGVAVATVGTLIILFNSFNQSIEGAYPGFPFWIMPLLLAFIAVLLGVLVWRRLRDDDILKYEFITVIAHKFRTPLTESKWAASELLLAEKDPEKRINLKQIEESNEKLVNLTGMLIDLADADNNIDSMYKMEKSSLTDLVKEAADPFVSRFKGKGVSFSAEYPASDIITTVDRNRMVFVIQTLLENSRNYTPNGGKVTVSLTRSGRKALVSVTDTGIGIKREELSRIFSRFYRTKNAQSADTEGFGIGLSLARSIINHHNGKIEVYSEGEDKGSTFTIILPIV
jgi:signal transduction histidine kinase